MSVFHNWLLEKAEQNSFLYVKRLFANDTGATGGHQVGLYIPSGIVEKLFPSINHIRELNPSLFLNAHVSSHECPDSQARAIYYNNRAFEGTRNEKRITRWGRGSPLQNPENTGALTILAFALDEHAEDCTGVDTDEALLSEAIANVGKQHGIDFLVNNAGKTRRVEAHEVEADFWRDIHALNVDALFRTSQLCYPWLKQSPHVGRIVNVSSMAAHMGFDGVTPYCSTKAAVMGITCGLAVEWSGQNVLVNAVAPGWVKTNMTSTVADSRRLEKILARMPLYRYGDAWSELAPVFCFLLSDAAHYINGQEIAVDGGALSFGF